MLIGIKGCENDAEEVRLLLIISTKFAQTGTWANVADTVSEAGSDPEAATPVPILNAQECEDCFRRLCQVLSLSAELPDSDKAVQLSESLRVKRLHQIRSNIRLLDEMIGVLESDEALLDNQDTLLDLSVIEQHLASAKDLFFAFPKSASQDSTLPLVPIRKVVESSDQAGAPGSQTEKHVETDARPDSAAAITNQSSLPAFNQDNTTRNGALSNESAAQGLEDPDSESDSAVHESVVLSAESALQSTDAAVCTSAEMMTAGIGIPGANSSSFDNQHAIPLSVYQFLPVSDSINVGQVAAEASRALEAIPCSDLISPGRSRMLDPTVQLPSNDAVSRQYSSDPNLGMVQSRPLYDGDVSMDVSLPADLKASALDLLVQRSQFQPSDLFGSLVNPAFTTPSPVPTAVKKPGKGRPKKKTSTGSV